MKDGLFNAAMRGAAVILFVIAILVPIVSMANQVIMLSLSGAPMSSYSSSDSHGVLLPLLLALVGSLQGAVLPFFGAAVLWRWDLRNARGEKTA